MGDFTATRSRKPKPRFRARGAAGGDPTWAAGSARLRGCAGSPCLALRWLRRALGRSPRRALPPPARGEFGCCARGRRGYEGFESAQAAEWSSHLFPPPATGLNFCKFELNRAFFCCLPEGACSPPRAAPGRERPPGAQQGASQPAGPESVRAGGGGRAEAAEVPGIGDRGAGPRPPPPLPGRRGSPLPRVGRLSPAAPTEPQAGSHVLKGARAAL